MMAPEVFCIHDLPFQSHPQYGGFFRRSLADLGVDAERSGLLHARRATRVKVAAWLGDDALYRDFIASYRGRLLAQIQPVHPQALDWLPLSIGLMLSEGFVDFHQGWFSLTGSAQDRVAGSLVKSIDLWRRANPRSSLPGRKPRMARPDLEHFGLSLLLDAARAEHRLMPVLVGLKFRPDLAESIQATPSRFTLAQHELPLVLRAVTGFFRLTTTH